MAHPSIALIRALESTVARLKDGATYRWTHMGACNCGHLAQTVTQHSREELHRMALQKSGDWGEQVVDHCPTSGFPIDHVIDTLLSLGLTRNDLWHLERLSDPVVARRARQDGKGHLDHRRREDVVRYFEAWADLLREGLVIEGDRVDGAGQTPPAPAPAVAAAIKGAA
jgi:hypothetical protein